MDEHNGLTAPWGAVRIKRRLKIYAIVETGGRQYRVSPGQMVSVEKLPGDEGSPVELGRVLMVEEEGKVTLGTPFIAGAKVVAQVQAQGRGQKVIVFKYKAKTRYRHKQGHRQPFTQLAIQAIVLAGAEKAKEE